MISPVIVLLAFAAPEIYATITLQFDCASIDNAGDWRYDANAVACENSIEDATCEVLYKDAANALPIAGADTPRPPKCYTKATPAIDKNLVSDAANLCPKTCGYCCKNSAYTCKNKEFPRKNCATATASMCRNPIWRTILAEDCPATCGLCNEGGCVDAIVGCANDPTICITIGLEDFVNKNCQRTCGKCSTSTTVSPGNTVNPGNGNCNSYIADSSTSCRAWAANGFCTNNFYTVAQRRSSCATTCKIC